MDRTGEENIFNELTYMTKRVYTILKKHEYIVDIYTINHLSKESARQKKNALFLENNELVESVDEETSVILDNLSSIRTWVQLQAASPKQSSDTDEVSTN